MQSRRIDRRLFGIRKGRRYLVIDYQFSDRSKINSITNPFVDMTKTKFEVRRVFDNSLPKRRAFSWNCREEVFGTIILVVVELNEGSPW